MDGEAQLERRACQPSPCSGGVPRGEASRASRRKSGPLPGQAPLKGGVEQPKQPKTSGVFLTHNLMSTTSRIFVSIAHMVLLFV